MAGMRAQDIGGETTTTQTTGKDGSTTTTTTRKWNVGTADVALACVTLLCLVLFLLSLVVKDLREAVGGALPVLLGVFTLAVGGTAAYRTLLKKT